MAQQNVLGNKKAIVIATLLLEGGLVVVTALWSYFSHSSLALDFSASIVGFGVLGAGPIFLINWLFFGDHTKHIRALSQCYEFKVYVVRPLVAELDVYSAIVVAVFAGLGEELFFRGLVQANTGVVFASVLFSVLHFGTAIKKYYVVGGIYILIGAYFSFLLSKTGSLITPIIAHATYDFVAIVYMRYFFHSPVDEELANVTWR